MTRGRHIWALAAGTALALLALPPVAHAAPPGSVSDYKLPPGPTAAPPPVQGPVDPDVPSARPTRPATPPTAPTAAPSTGEPPRVVLPSFTPTPTPTQRQRQQRTAPTTPIALPTESGTETTQPVIAASPAPLPLPEATPLTPPATRSWPSWLWAALAGMGALLAIAGAVRLLRRRRSPEDAPADEPEPLAAPEASAPAALSPASRPPASTAPEPEPSNADLPNADLDVRLEASQFSRTLVYATLAYRLTLTNRTAAALPPARVLADLISAHASLAAEEQLSLDAAALHLKHDMPALAPQEPLSLAGELRIPVAAIRPIMQGGAALFVPLARFRIETADGGSSDHVYVVGEPADRPRGALKPLRIDGLPGVVRPLDQRRVVASAA